MWAAVLAVMNSVFYLAIDRLPLGTVAAIEFLPVIVLAAFAARTGRNLLALALAVAGVYLLTDVRLVAEPLGLRVRRGQRRAVRRLHRARRTGSPRTPTVSGIDGLALAMLIAAVLALPVGHRRRGAGVHRSARAGRRASASASRRRSSRT